MSVESFTPMALQFTEGAAHKVKSLVDEEGNDRLKLRVWVDGTHDAKVDAGELKTLAELGITQINVRAAASTQAEMLRRNLWNVAYGCLVTSATLTALGKAFITVNKNSVPNDPRSPFVTSGLRFGTPAVTTRGFKEAECKELAGWICDILADLNNEAVIDAVREKVKAICKKLPVYGA